MLPASEVFEMFDNILLLENGKVAGAGTYESLMESNSTFRAFARAVSDEGGE